MFTMVWMSSALSTMTVRPVRACRTGRGHCVLFVHIFLFCAALTAPGRLQAQESAAFYGRPVSSIDYHADRPLEKSHFDSLIGIKPGDPLTHTALKGAMQALYDTGNFSSIAADASPEGSGVRLIFDLRLNYYFNLFTVEGDVDFAGRSPAEVLSLPVGEPFSETRLEASRLALEKYLKDQGFYRAQVRTQVARDEATRQVDTTFEVKPGELARISSVDISGIPPSEEAIIREKLGFQPGQKYKRSRLRRRVGSLRQYFVSRGFLAASPALKEVYEPADNTVALILEVTGFGRIRVVVDGFKIDRTRLRRLLPVLSGGGVQQDLLEEGQANLKDYLDEQGYPEAVVDVHEERDANGVLVVRYSIEAGRKVTVASVGFEDNKVLSAEDLLKVIQIQPSHFLQKSIYSVMRLDSDVESIRTLYNSRGYLDAEIIPLVKSEKGAEKLSIVFVCREGPLYRAGSVEVKGNQALATATLLQKMELRKGGAYSPHIAERDRQALLAAYNDAGFLQARVTYRAGKPDEKKTCSVEFEITEGSRVLVDRVLVLGNRRTRESVIDKRILLRKDEPLSLGKMLQTQQGLYSTGVFDRVRVAQQDPESTTPYQNVIVRLDEASRFTIRYGLGYQETEKLRGTVELSDISIFGTGRRADLSLRGSRIEQFGVLNFQQPRYRYPPVDTYLTLSAQAKREVSFDVKRYNISYQLGKGLSGHSWALFRYNFQNVRVSNVTAEPSREDTPRNLSTFSAIYINDTRDNYLDPERGFFTSTDFSVTTKLLGSNNYVSLFTQNNYFRKIRNSILMATSLRFGAMKPYGGDTEIPISQRFFAGGASTLRGFETDEAGPVNPANGEPLGGNALFIFNIEARLPIMRLFSVAGFYDTGNVFAQLSDMTLPGFSHDVGLGIRIKTPFGPLRADYGVNLNLPPDRRALGFKTGHLFLTIGPPF